MSRGVALLISIIGGAAAAFVVIAALTVALAGVLWIYVFGDDPWPAWAERSLDIAIPLIGLALWAIFARLIWKRLTAPPSAG